MAAGFNAAHALCSSTTRGYGRAVGRDLGRDRADAHSPAEKAPRGRQVALRGYQVVDDLAMLIDRPSSGVNRCTHR